MWEGTWHYKEIFKNGDVLYCFCCMDSDKRISIKYENGSYTCMNEKTFNKWGLYKKLTDKEVFERESK